MQGDIWQFILDNKEWLFSGIGGVIIAAIWGFFFRKKSSINQSIKSGNHSTNVQTGQDVHINNDGK